MQPADVPDLGDYVLGNRDLPETFIESPRIDRDPALPAGWTTTDPGCRALLHRFDLSHPEALLLGQAHLDRYFTNPRMTYSVGSSAAAWETTTQAQEVFEVIARFPETCPLWTDDDGHGTTVTTEVDASSNSLADPASTFMTTITATGQFQTRYVVEWAAARRNNVIVLLARATRHDQPQRPSATSLLDRVLAR